jgi:glutamate synthase domain-containing protein 1
MGGDDGQRPDSQGLYDPQFEHDSCGVGFVVDIKGRPSHRVIELGIQLLVNLLHRGACGCEANTGDGAGILIQMPDRFLRKEAQALGFALPGAGDYGAGLVFLPRDPGERHVIETLIRRILDEEHLTLLGWREVPTDDSMLGARAVASEPVFQQVFVGRGKRFPFDADPEQARARLERK